MRSARRAARAGLVAAMAVLGTPGVALAGTISGTVTNEATGAPVEGICVHVTDGFVDVAGSPATTDVTGGYAVSGLNGGYRIQFVDCRPGGLLIGEYYDDTDQSGADRVGVSGATTVDVDAALTPGGAIAGTVTREGSGTPIEDVCVRVETDTESPAVSKTAADGTYRLVAPAGRYTLTADGACAPGTWVSESIPDIDVVAGNTLSGRDFQLAEDVTGPVVSFTAPSPSEGATSGTGVTFAVTTDEDADLSCSLDGAAFADCRLPKALDGLAAGPHTFAVKGTDPYGNDGDPATRHWTVATGGGTAITGTGESTTGAGATTAGGGNAPQGSSPPAAPAAQRCIVPKLVGTSLAKAKKALGKGHCALGKVARKHKKGRRKGTVIAQKPPASSTKPAGAKVKLVVAK